MHEEQAFLDQLKADPTDEVTRLVYADWLEERGDPRGAWLRAEGRLAATREDDPSFEELDLDVGEQSRAIDGAWLAIAGRRWDVWLIRYQLQLKIPVIKGIRTLTGCGLAEGKALSEALPCRVVRACQRAQAETARDYLPQCWPHYQSIPLPHVVAAIRPCADPEAGLSAPWLGSFALMLLGERPGKRETLLAVLHQLFSWTESHARNVLAEPLPACLRYFLREAEAQQAARALEGSALVEVRTWTPPRRSVQQLTWDKGNHDVWLLDYPSEKRISVIRSYRAATGAELAEAKSWADQAPPLLVVGEIDGPTVEQVRSLFLGLGTLEVRTRPGV
jgi:uncharacterized protein (TIGR02996 family)